MMGQRTYSLICRAVDGQASERELEVLKRAVRMSVELREDLRLQREAAAALDAVTLRMPTDAEGVKYVESIRARLAMRPHRLLSMLTRRRLGRESRAGGSPGKR